MVTCFLFYKSAQMVGDGRLFKVDCVCR